MLLVGIKIPIKRLISPGRLKDVSERKIIMLGLYNYEEKIGAYYEYTPKKTKEEKEKEQVTARIQQVYDIEFEEFMKLFKLDEKLLTDYMYNRSANLAVDEKVQNALVDVMEEINQNITETEILQTLYKLNLE